MNAQEDAITIAQPNTGRTLTQVATGNGEPDLFRDDEGRAYWSDGSPITRSSIAAMDSDDAELMESVLDAFSLDVHGESKRALREHRNVELCAEVIA